MALRFWYEFAIGIITFTAILLFGERGIAALVALAFLPIIMRLKKIKADERETQLFYKGTQIIFTGIIFIIIISFLLTDLQLSDLISVKKEIWFMILSGFMIVNGSVRLYLLYKK